MEKATHQAPKHSSLPLFFLLFGSIATFPVSSAAFFQNIPAQKGRTEWSGRVQTQPSFSSSSYHHRHPSSSSSTTTTSMRTTNVGYNSKIALFLVPPRRPTNSGRDRNILVSDLFVDEYLGEATTTTTMGGGGGRPHRISPEDKNRYKDAGDDDAIQQEQQHNKKEGPWGTSTGTGMIDRPLLYAYRQDFKVPALLIAKSTTTTKKKKEKKERQQHQQHQEQEQQGLCTSVGGNLVHKFGIQCPMDRMAVTSSGNLQKLVSAYHDAKVNVVVEHNQEKDREGCWDRVVRMSISAKKKKNDDNDDNDETRTRTFCTATSTVHVLDKECNEMLRSGKIGLGQLFHHYGVQPRFRLLDAGYRKKGETSDNEDGGLWRLYELVVDDLIVCRIREDFVPGMWSLF